MLGRRLSVITKNLVFTTITYSRKTKPLAKMQHVGSKFDIYLSFSFSSRRKVTMSPSAVYLCTYLPPHSSCGINKKSGLLFILLEKF